MFTLLGLHTVLFSCAPAVWQLRLNELCYVMLWSCVTSQRPTSYTDRLHTQRSRSHSSRTSVRAMWTFPLTCMCSEPELSSGSVQFIRWERRRHDVRRQTLAIACGALHVSPGGCFTTVERLTLYVRRAIATFVCVKLINNLASRVA